MSLRYLVDVHVQRAITAGLRARGIDVLTAQEEGLAELADPLLLDRASELGRVLFSRDSDLLCEAARRQAEGVFFAGVVYAHALRVSIGDCIRDMEILAKVVEPDEMHHQLVYLPL